jgi:hypothetical protein
MVVPKTILKGLDSSQVTVAGQLSHFVCPNTRYLEPPNDAAECVHSCARNCSSKDVGLLSMNPELHIRSDRPEILYYVSREAC